MPRVSACGLRLRLVPLIEQDAGIGRILRHLDLPAEIPGPSATRAPPLPIELDAHPCAKPVAFDS